MKKLKKILKKKLKVSLKIHFFQIEMPGVFDKLKIFLNYITFYSCSEVIQTG